MIPSTIPFTSVLITDRARSTYTGIDDLADSIAELGLIQPIILVPCRDIPAGPDVMDGVVTGYKLDAGGRRCRALETLLADGRWDGTLHHSVSSTPGQPGFVLRAGEASDETTSLMIELAENLDREDLDWRDEAKLVARAFRLSQKNALAEQRDVPDLRLVGAGLKCGYNELRCAVAIYDELVSHPEKFKECTDVRKAYQVMLMDVVKQGEAIAAKQLQAVSKSNALERATEIIKELDAEEAAIPAPPTIPLTSRFLHRNGMDFLREAPALSFDHIISDPDYAVAVDDLEGRPDSSLSKSDGVAQSSVAESLSDLHVLIREAFRVARYNCILWCDIRHWWNLRSYALSVGWVGQPWPLIWHKNGPRPGNAAANFNWTKNHECVLVLRKQGVTLAKPQHSSVIAFDGMAAIKQFGHPFAKPVEVWQRLYDAVASPGQSVLDPCCGSGSAFVAAMSMNLQPFGCEIQEEIYNRGLSNIMAAYRKALGENVRFE